MCALSDLDSKLFVFWIFGQWHGSTEMVSRTLKFVSLIPRITKTLCLTRLSTVRNSALVLQFPLHYPGLQNRNVETWIVVKTAWNANISYSTTQTYSPIVRSYVCMYACMHACMYVRMYVVCIPIHRTSRLQMAHGGRQSPLSCENVTNHRASA